MYQLFNAEDKQKTKLFGKFKMPFVNYLSYYTLEATLFLAERLGKPKDS